MHDPAAGVDPSAVVAGGHAMSESSDILGKWNYDYWKGGYGLEIEWSSSAPNLTRRERPKVLFNSYGEPIWLFNGVSLDARNGDGDRNSFTLVQKIVRFGGASVGAS